MHFDRVSPRARARWASLLGVIVASALVGGSLMGLSRDVLPFIGWPSLGGQGDVRQRLAAVPDLVRHARSGGGNQVAIAAGNRVTPLAGGAPLAAAPVR